MSLENPLLQFHKIKHQTSVHWDLSVCCQSVQTTQCKIDMAIISEDGKMIQTSMKHFLLLFLRNATKPNSIEFSATLLHVSFDKFWNCLKELRCNNVKFVFVGEQADFMKIICKTFYRYNVKHSETKLGNQHIFYNARNTCRMPDTGTSPSVSLFFFFLSFFLFFFQPPCLHKMVCFLNSWKHIVKTIVRLDASLIALSFGRNNRFNTCFRKEILSK